MVYAMGSHFISQQRVGMRMSVGLCLLQRQKGRDAASLKWIGPITFASLIAAAFSFLLRLPMLMSAPPMPTRTRFSSFAIVLPIFSTPRQRATWQGSRTMRGVPNRRPRPQPLDCARPSLTVHSLFLG